MSALHKLRLRLARINDVRPPKASWGDLIGIEAETKKLIAKYGGLAINPSERLAIEDAIRDYRRKGTLASFRETKYVCFGCGFRDGKDGYCLLEDSSRFPGLLKHVDQFQDSPTKYHRCYQGLLSSYFEFNPSKSLNDSGPVQWGMLRSYLDQNLELLVKNEKQATWVQTLNEHKNLLGTEPCSRYAKEMLHGQQENFRSMCDSLILSERTWVHQEIIMATIKAGCQLNDEQFCSRIPKFIEIIAPYSELQDDGISRLLRRYALIQGANEHVQLREISIKRWGNPWLHKNAPKWQSRVPVAVQNMVLGWLKRKWIHDFFSLLQADHAADKRRLDFWLRYVDEITDMHFALGRYAMESTKSDYRALRTELGDRLMALSSNNALNNAFLMCIGNYVFVEFGQQNNACHVFRRDLPMPFKLGQAKVSDTRQHLKDDSHPSHAMSLRHHDGHQRWEDNFKYAINKLTRSLPTQTATKTISPTGGNGLQPTTTNTINATGSIPRFDTKHFSERALQEMAADHNLDIDDLRSRNGNLWVRTDDKNAEVSRLLIEWGFRYKALKGWWRD